MEEEQVVLVMKHLVDQVKQVIVVIHWNGNDILSISLLAPGIVKVTVTNTTVMWIPPEQPNGVIIAYEVRYFNQCDSDAPPRIEQLLGPNETMYTHTMSNLGKKSM